MPADDPLHRKRAGNGTRRATASFVQVAGSIENPSAYRRSWRPKSQVRYRWRGGRRERDLERGQAALRQNLSVSLLAQPPDLSLKLGHVAKPSQHRIVASRLEEFHGPA